MDGWIHGWMDGWMNGWMDRQIGRQGDRWVVDKVDRKKMAYIFPVLSITNVIQIPTC